MRAKPFSARCRISFTYVRCFRGVGGQGIHMLASMQPIETTHNRAGRLRLAGRGRT